MTKVRTWTGLDVHAAKVIACVVDAESGEMTVRRLPGETEELVAFCAGLPAPARVAYEAGPTGFGLSRALTEAGVGCVIAAPGKIERPAQVRVAGNQEEAIRDLVRAREDIRGDLMRARHRLGKLLLRHVVRYDGEGDHWTARHRAGQTRRQGAITKTGSRHARRLLVEAAWHYRRPPRLGTVLERRQADQPQVAVAISWKAQQRLHQIWRRLDHQRGERRAIVAVAVARHLAGFCWAITNTNPQP